VIRAAVIRETAGRLRIAAAICLSLPYDTKSHEAESQRPWCGAAARRRPTAHAPKEVSPRGSITITRAYSSVGIAICGAPPLDRSVIGRKLYRSLDLIIQGL
jgi:hypothetical protein